MLTILHVSHDGIRNQRFWLRVGQSATVGSSQEACFPIGGDPSLDAVHLALNCHSNGCLLKDLSGGRTTVNGLAIGEQELSDGDTIAAGGTTIEVVIEGQCRAVASEPSRTSDDAPPMILSATPGKAARYKVGAWHFEDAPEDWDFHPEKGFTKHRPGEKPEFLQVSEHILPSGTTLCAFESQLASAPETSGEDTWRVGPVPIAIPGSDEALDVRTRCRQHDSIVLQRQIFARQDQLLGIALLISMSDDADQAEQTFQSFVDMMSFRQTANTIASPISESA